MESKGRLLALDGLRGYAAMCVVIYHAILFFVAVRAGELVTTPIQVVASEDRAARGLVAVFNGELAVMIFFAISGAVLLRSLESDVKRIGLGRSLAIFPLKRVLRIYPALIVCLIVMAVVYAIAQKLVPATYQFPSVKDFALNATLYDVQAHGATWTLRAEIMAVPFILVAFLARMTFGITGLAAFLLYSVLVIEYPPLGLGVRGIADWLLYFAAGFLAHDLARSSTVVELMKGYRWIGIVVGLFALRAMLPPSSMAGALARLACIVVIIAYIFGEHRNGLKEHLASRVPVFFGRISYSLYLWNVLFLNIILGLAIKAEFVRSNYEIAGLVIGLATIALSIPIAVLSERWIERPCSSLLKKRDRPADFDAAWKSSPHGIVHQAA